ncbi:MAG: type I restriction endonuclease subunit R [Candidatus Electrothrix sp. AR3]|nr:type I restriction endonuclease subunit R [Candidatus Electrothrix sp. AR3]
MSSKPTQEKHFEEAIEDWLLNHSGYTKAEASQFDPALALDATTLLTFIKESQPQAYQTLTTRHGAKADQAIIKRVCAECDQRGLLDVLRNGLKDQGQQLQLAFFRPATSLNPETKRLYACNRLTLLRQVFFDTQRKSSIDLLLSLNGLPIATVELKNPFTGQTTSHAIRQYIKDRNPTATPPLLQFKKRALIHFAVDPDEVFMTTRLAGAATHFLPFNRGDHGGRGNPADHSYQTGYKSGYLWEEIWQRDSWLEIIQRFIFLEKKRKG